MKSIVGDWLASGNSSDQKPFSASFSFTDDNQYSTIVNIDGRLSTPINDTYNFSLTQEQLSLQPYGSTPVIYKIVETTSNSFTVVDETGSKTIFARAET